MGPKGPAGTALVGAHDFRRPGELLRGRPPPSAGAGGRLWKVADGKAVGRPDASHGVALWGEGKARGRGTANIEEDQDGGEDMADEDESCGMFEEEDDIDAYMVCKECEQSDDEENA